MKVFLFFILSSIIFVFSVLMSKGDDVFKLTGIISFVAFPIYLFCMCYKKNFEKIKKQVQVCGNYDIKTLLYETYGKNQEKKYKICSSCGCVFDEGNICPTCGCRNNDITKKEDKQAIKRNKNKYKNYNYSYERIKSHNDINFDELKTAYNDCAKNEYTRLRRAKYEDFTFSNYNEQNHTATTINSEQTKKYITTLTSCTCKDFKDRQKPCKHMYRLADGIVFNLYGQGEKEVVNRLMILWKNRQLVPLLIDIFYRIRDTKNNYYLKITPRYKKIADLNLIKLKDIPTNDFLKWKYNSNELKGMLYEKQYKKSISKKELIDLYVSDEKLLKKLPKSYKQITLNFDESQYNNIIGCLNYINYQN